jgi:hypothetical protein
MRLRRREQVVDELALRGGAGTTPAHLGHDATKYRVRVDVRTGDDGDWTELVTVTLTSPEPSTAGSYIAYRRDPADDAPPLPPTGE